MSNFIRVGLSAAVLIGGVDSVRAQVADFRTQDSKLFDKFDAGDGKLTKEEVGAYPWTRYDDDADGVVTKQEFQFGRLNDRLQANVETDAGKAFALLDWTGDGQLSGGELDGGVWLRFDADGDQVVNKSEFLAAKGVNPDAPTPAVPGPASAKSDAAGAIAKARESQAKLIEAVANGDERAAHALLHPLLQQKVSRAMMQVHFDIYKSQMGAVTDRIAAAELGTETIEGETYVVARQQLQCAQGPVEVSSTFVDGNLVSFQLTAPQLEPALVERLVFQYLLELGDDTEDFAKQFLPECEKFVRTVFDVGADEALALLDPRVEKGLREKGAGERLAALRATYGPVTDLELVSFRLEANADKTLDKFMLKLEAKRPGKRAGEIEFSYMTEGMFTAIVGYAFEEGSDDSAPPPNVAPPSGGTPPGPLPVLPPIAPPGSGSSGPPPAPLPVLPPITPPPGG